MRITVTVDDDLMANAGSYSGLTSKSAIIEKALRELVERESARRLAALGGSQPRLTNVRRRR
ncbi:type II toxin-antitoxin system VapB family antitoxin [Aquabacter sp. CN5-332]|uniref:type II toxin-antitoxin system VapB family antitoxin n=1 Tax=Aquabacter sp. CN5-332 TaxID=3156608 RepID=UPI0032B4E5BE